MGMVVRTHGKHIHLVMLPKPLSPIATFSSSNSLLFSKTRACVGLEKSLSVKGGNQQRRRRREVVGIVVASSTNVAAPFWDSWKPDKGSKAPSLSDIVWPSAGAFAAMAVLGRMDQFLAAKGLSITIAPLGAVCAVLFANPSSPGARKYNMFMAQIGCAAIGVLAFSIFGPSWLARSSGLAAAIAFMIYTGSVHPPAASLPLLFIDGAKLHHLNFWYALFPGATGCIVLCLIVSFFLLYRTLILHLIATVLNKMKKVQYSSSLLSQLLTIKLSKKTFSILKTFTTSEYYQIKMSYFHSFRRKNQSAVAIRDDLGWIWFGRRSLVQKYD